MDLVRGDRGSGRLTWHEQNGSRSMPRVDLAVPEGDWRVEASPTSDRLVFHGVQ